MKKVIPAVLILCFLVTTLVAQQAASYFQPIPAKDAAAIRGTGTREHWPAVYQTFRLDYTALQSALQLAPQEFSAAARQHTCVINIPAPNGTLEPFAVWQIALLEPELAADCPYLHTYAGESLRHPGRMVRISTTLRGFRAMVLRPDLGIDYVEPYVWGQEDYYIAFDRASLPQDQRGKLETRFVGEEAPLLRPEEQPFAPAVEDRGPTLEPLQLKVYRFAVSTTGEFAEDHGGTKPLVLSAIMEYVNMISAIFERDIDLRLQLIAGTQNAIFLDPATDPFSGVTVQDWMGQNSAVLAQYTNVNSHDIGHVFARYISGGAIGVAGGFACNGSKDAGCTAGNGVGDYGDFFVGVAGQELGHQMSGGHTWNNCGDNGGRAGNTAFEPGSGSTIMSYAGACGADNVQNNADLYYHSGSIEEIRNFYTYSSGAACGSYIQTTNNAPIVTLSYKDNFFIPISTPFELTGSANDPDGNALSYNWEELDSGPEAPISQPIANSAIFRTRLADTLPNRYFPRLTTVIANGFDKTEQLPTYTRDLTFRLTARDNQPNGGGVGWADVAFKAYGPAGPFVVSSPNTAAAIWHVGEFAPVTWSVAGTNLAPVNCQKVNIRLSTDGGKTYPVVLATGVDNDGEHFIKVPNTVSNTARVRVDAADNVFFDISNASFKIQQPQQASLTVSLTDDYQQICLPPVFTTEIQTAAVLGFSTPVQLDLVDGLPAGATASFSAATLNPGESATLTINCQGVTQAATYTVHVRMTIPGYDTIIRPVVLTYVSNDFAALALSQPADGAAALALNQILHWNSVPDANKYDVRIATSPAFLATDIVASKTNVTVDSFKVGVLLQKGTGYYWQVRPINECPVQNWTEPFFFSTFAENCSVFTAGDLPKNMTANGTPTIESKITVNAGSVISDLNVKQIKGYHEFFKDLDVRLISPQNTEVLLFKDKCGNSSGYFNFGLDDAAQGAFPCPPANNTLAYPPANPLSVFNGQSSTGAWTLRLKDNVVGSGGTITDFKLEFCATASLNPPFLVNNNTLQIAPGTNAVIGADLLRTDDPDDPHTNLTYTLLTVPEHGDLQNNWGGTLQPGAQFTQTEIDNGALRFFDAGNNAGPDGFRFMVTDGKGGFLATPKFNIQPLMVGTVEQNQRALDFGLFPNPATEQVWVTFGQPTARNTRIRLFNAAGQLVLTQIAAVGVEQVELPLHTLPGGIYVVQIENEDGVGVRKLMLESK